MNSIVPGDNIARSSQNNFQTSNLNSVIWASIIMAIAGMGDAILYIHLPINGASLGMQTLTIGVLLSINKCIRFFSNKWVAKFAVYWGIKTTMKLGVIIAAITTLIYALNSFIWLWIMARLFWGISYSALRFSSIQYATNTNKPSRSLGLAKSIQELGPILAYLIGPLAINTFGSQTTFMLLGLITFALLFAFNNLKQIKPETQTIAKFQLKIPNSREAWITIASFTIDGLLVVGISFLIDVGNSSTQALLISTGLYIAIRRIFNSILAPLSGWICNYMGFILTYNISCLIILSGFFLITINHQNYGIVIAFLGASLNTTLNPLFAIYYTPKDKNFATLTNLANAQDVGSAIGAFVGAFVLSNYNHSFIFGMIIIIMTIIWFKLNKFVNNYERNN